MRSATRIPWSTRIPPRWPVWLTAQIPLGSASFHICIVAAAFATVCPISGSLGDRLGDRRMILVAGAMALLAVIYTLMGPWQVAAWGLEARRRMLYVYLAADGLMCCLLEPQFFPQMLSLAESTSSGPPNEHLTNFVTSLGQTAFNVGGVAGPFVAVPIIRRWGGFRGALATWAVPFALVATWAALRICRGGPATRKPPARSSQANDVLDGFETVVREGGSDTVRVPAPAGPSRATTTRGPERYGQLEEEQEV